MKRFLNDISKFEYNRRKFECIDRVRLISEQNIGNDNNLQPRLDICVGVDIKNIDKLPQGFVTCVHRMRK